MKIMNDPGGLECFQSDLKKHPTCPHGPTLLFGRYVDGGVKKFYACSACRDRKLCTFYADYDETVSEARKKAWKAEAKKSTPNYNHIKLFIRFNEIMAENPERRAYCNDCEKLIALTERPKHSNHNIRNGIGDEEMKNPTMILKPLSNVKKEAQYLFSKKASIEITNMLVKAGAQQVLCIGAPRIHEYISQKLDKVSSLLLDFDGRFHNFFGPLSYCHYNLFNHHFFTDEGAQIYRDFMTQNSGKNTFVICDPPFGGRVEAISQTLKTIENEHAKWNGIVNENSRLKIVFVFPYFMEPIIRRKSNPPGIPGGLRDLEMVDYKVDYDNHPLFMTGSSGRKHGSPVRLFTNISLSILELPAEDGYKYCGKCKKWISAENKHCKLCKSCTSKDGRRYRHCKICQRCVKPTWKHCVKCDKCILEKHVCGEKPKITGRCFTCGDNDHIGKDCKKLIEPLEKSSKTRVAKRKNANEIPIATKKRKISILPKATVTVNTVNTVKVKKSKTKATLVNEVCEKLIELPGKSCTTAKKRKNANGILIMAKKRKSSVLPKSTVAVNAVVKKVKKMKTTAACIEKTTEKLVQTDEVTSSRVNETKRAKRIIERKTMKSMKKKKSKDKNKRGPMYY